MRPVMRISRLTLADFKRVYQCLAEGYETDAQNGLIEKPTQVLFTKLDTLIGYLEAQQYPDS